MRGTTTKLWPPRDLSRSNAARSVSGEKVDTAVRIGWRRAGASR
ncbi:hypothetical protein P0F65_07565 [Sphingomonas sp. I4]